MRNSASRAEVGRVALALALAAVLASGSGQAQAPAGARSVVRISCRLPGGQESRGTGFVWRSPTSVVTALHVVAGCLAISVESEQKAGGGSSGATIDKVLREGDLALLRLEKTLGLEPLKEAATINLAEEHSIWGYPKDVRTMQGDDLRFSRSLNAAPTLEDVMTETQYRRSIGDQGYPAWRARILRVSSTITPGHSGAPIFDKAGLVVGMGDGGLHQGIQRINWAIPVSVYLQRLVSSTEPTRVERGTTGAHFAEVVSTADLAPTPAAPPTTDGNVLVHLWTASVREILETADDEEREATEEFIADAKMELGVDLGASELDIYEDPESGATAAVPTGAELTFDPDTRMIEATSESGRVTLYIRIAGEDGPRAMESFWSYLEDLEDWELVDDSEDEEIRERDGQQKFSRVRGVTGANDEPSARLISMMTLDDDDAFLGVAVAMTDMANATPDDIRMLYLWAIGGDFSGFTLD